MTKKFMKKRTLTKKVNHIEKILKQEKPENKFFDVDFSTFTATSSSNAPLVGNGSIGSLLALEQIQQGTDRNQRVGNEIMVKSINLKWTPSMIGTAGSITRQKGFRTFLIRDTQQISDTLPTIGDIFSNPHPNSYVLNIANNRRFKIIEKSDYFTNNTVGSGTWVPSDKPLELNLFHKFKYPHKVRFNGTAGSDFQKNVDYVAVLGETWNQAGQTDTGSYNNMTCRVKYIDS